MNTDSVGFLGAQRKCESALKSVDLSVVLQSFDWCVVLSVSHDGVFLRVFVYTKHCCF